MRSKFLLFSLLALFALSFFSQVAFAQCCSRSGFSAPLDERWAEIPQETLLAFSKKIAESRPGLPKQSFDYAFQWMKGRDKKAVVDNAFSYPYVLVQIFNTGRPDEAVLKKFKSLSAPAEIEKELGKAFEQDFPAQLSRITYAEPVYDDEAKIVWSKTLSRVQGVGEIVALSGSLLTAQGAITFHCYTRLDEFERFVKPLSSFVRSVRLAPPLEY